LIHKLIIAEITALEAHQAHNIIADSIFFILVHNLFKIGQVIPSKSVFVQNIFQFLLKRVFTAQTNFALFFNQLLSFK
jgi:hypothetical protein